MMTFHHDCPVDGHGSCRPADPQGEYGYRDAIELMDQREGRYVCDLCHWYIAPEEPTHGAGEDCAR